MSFEVVKNSAVSLARSGKLGTSHGVIKTPFFMPIATQASVKGVTAAEMKNLASQILLSNTYHLWLRPGSDVVAEAGGLHQFMNWDGPILTDSGGYQVFSLAKIRKLKADGVEFQSHLNGETRFLSPEQAIEIQQQLGSDIMMVLDECSPYPCTRPEAEVAVNRTTDWARKCKLKHKGQNPELKQLLFGIVQGSVYKNLRLKSVGELKKIGFDGYAIGGLAVGEPVEEMYEVLNYLVPEMPKDRPRYLMGVGYPEQIVESVKRGVDMFDCVLPTRNARHGSIFVASEQGTEYLPGKFYEVVKIKNQQYTKDFSVLDNDCDCPACRGGYTKAYLRHLLIAKESLYIRLASLHNLRFYLKLMEDIRQSIQKGPL